jgi:flagellin FlaB
MKGLEGLIHTKISLSQNGALGIGAMIVFIAMILTAGFAVYVLVSTSTDLEVTSGTTGRETIQDVSTGIKISTIEGHTTAGSIDKIVIIITPRPGSPNIGLGNMVLELSNTSIKSVVNYASDQWIDGTSGLPDIFSTNAFSLTGSEFGVIVLKDDDSSCLQNTPVINQGDSVMVTLNTSSIFNGIAESENILGYIIPQEGAWSIIEFRTPSSFTNAILILQED